jgi:heme-degrading monooxygenase HmoA
MSAAAENGQFAIVFEYRVSDECLAAFERVYGSDGEWARFFADDPVYRGSELWAFQGQPGRYLVVDRWDSAAAYHDFRERVEAEYERRSADSASLYNTERLVGEFRRSR